MFDVELGIKVPELFVVKLSTVIDDDGPREVELTDDGLSYELSDFGLGDLGHRLSFHPFSEVVDGHKQEFSLH